MQISMTTLQSMQSLKHCSAVPAEYVVRVCFKEGAEDWCYELPEKPPSGLSSSRLSQFLQEFEYAMNKRQQSPQGQATPPFYHDLRERKVHVTWLTAHADSLENEARMSRLFASRISGGIAA